MTNVHDKIGLSVSMLSKWFDTMQISKGAYGGPIVHWWLCSFIYCGPGANWTYEGLIEAYLELHRKTRNEVWLKHAMHAGNYLASVQMPDGTYKNSFFEINPLYGSSSVHEAGVDLGLLSLAFYLEGIGENIRARKYLDVAMKNAEMSLYQRLWDPIIKTFRSTDDRLVRSTYVINIMATVAQVFLKLYSYTKKAKYLELVSSTLFFILRYQRTNPNSVLFGSFPQGLHNGDAFALYSARIASFLIDVYETLGEEKALEAAEFCGTFLRSLEQKDGGFACFVDRGGTIHNYPKLIGGVAETTRALLRLKNRSAHHSDFEEKTHIEWLLKFQDSIGGFRTGEGFHYNVERNDYKDLFHVCGWNDKVFRLLASLFRGHALKDEKISQMEEICWIGQAKALFTENENDVIIQDRDGKIIYRWLKGDNLAFVDNNYLEYFLRMSPAQSTAKSAIRSTVGVFL